MAHVEHLTARACLRKARENRAHAHDPAFLRFASPEYYRDIARAWLVQARELRARRRLRRAKAAARKIGR